MDATDLAFAGIARQAELVRTGEVTPRELVELSLERIARLDPQLNSVRVVLAEQARAEADVAGDLQAAGAPRAGGDPRAGGARHSARDPHAPDSPQPAGDPHAAGNPHPPSSPQAATDVATTRPLHGVPILIKDDVDVAGQLTTYGTAAHGGPATADAEVVKRLREAGAIVIGKTLTPEMTQWPFTESATWGVTRNPWDLQRTPGGSSGGSAAAVAAGLAGAALATDGAGSIRIPAACCALFGLKPQRGRVPEAPKHEPWQDLTTTGCLTRSVRDTALWLDVTADRAAHERAHEPATFQQAASTEPPSLRIAYSTRNPLFAPVAPEQREAFEATIALLRELGHTVEQAHLPLDPVLPQVVIRYLRGIAEDAARLPHPERLERRTKGMVRMGRLLPDGAVRWARAAEQRTTDRLGELFARYDVLLNPALAALPLPIGRYEGRGALWTFNGVARFTPFTPAWNVTGQPAAAVPAGFTPAGVPLSVQLVGRPYAEATLLSLAAQLETARPWSARRPTLAE